MISTLHQRVFRRRGPLPSCLLHAVLFPGADHASSKGLLAPTLMNNTLVGRGGQKAPFSIILALVTSECSLGPSVEKFTTSLLSSDCSRFFQLHCLSQFSHQGHCKQFLIFRFILSRDKYLLPFIHKLWRNLQCSVITLHGYGFLQLIYHLKEIRGQSCILKNVAPKIRAGHPYSPSYLDWENGTEWKRNTKAFSTPSPSKSSLLNKFSDL